MCEDDQEMYEQGPRGTDDIFGCCDRGVRTGHGSGCAVTCC